MRIIGWIFGICFLILLAPAIALFIGMFIIAWLCGVKIKITVDKREIGYLRWFKVTYY